MTSDTDAFPEKRDADHGAFRLGRIQRAVLLEMADEDRPRSVAEIAKRIGLTTAKVGNAMSRLRNNSFVQPVRPAKWIITRDGLRAINIPHLPHVASPPFRVDDRK